jgi:Ca-activated chloride channel family protein
MPPGNERRLPVVVLVVGGIGAFCGLLAYLSEKASTTVGALLGMLAGAVGVLLTFLIDKESPRTIRLPGRPRISLPRTHARRFLVILAAICVPLAGVAAWLVVGPAGCADPDPVTVVSSTEKVPVLAEAAEAYRRRDGCAKAAVRVVGVPSGTAAKALARGWDAGTRAELREAGYQADQPPDLWTPASSVWVARAVAIQRRAGRSDVTFPASSPLAAQTPLVVAMPESRARALGWPARSFGWDDFVELAREKVSLPGKQAWGPFTLGKTNPEVSTSGLHATIALHAASAGGRLDDIEQLAGGRVAQEMHDVEQAISDTGPDTVTMLCQIRDRAESAPWAVFVEEKSVIDYNLGLRLGDAPACRGLPPTRPAERLVALYPREGTLFSDNPLIIPGAPWVTAAKRAAAQEFVNYLRSGPSQERFRAAGFRDQQGGTGDAIQPANGVDPGGVRVLDGRPADPTVVDAVLRSWEQARKPAKVLLVMDVSQSMRAPASPGGDSRMAEAVKAAAGALERVSPRDEVGLWSFSTGLDRGRDWRQLVPVGPIGDEVGGVTRQDLLAARLHGLRPTSGGTGLLDTVRAATRTLRATYPVAGHDGDGDTAAYGVVVLTDGQSNDRRPEVSAADLRRELITDGFARPVRVFTVVYGPGGCDTLRPSRIVEVTDGTCHEVGAGRFRGAFDDVFANFWGLDG